MMQEATRGVGRAAQAGNPLLGVWDCFKPALIGFKDSAALPYFDLIKDVLLFFPPSSLRFVGQMDHGRRCVHCSTSIVADVWRQTINK